MGSRRRHPPHRLRRVHRQHRRTRRPRHRLGRPGRRDPGLGRGTDDRLAGPRGPRRHPGLDEARSTPGPGRRARGRRGRRPDPLRVLDRRRLRRPDSYRLGRTGRGGLVLRPGHAGGHHPRHPVARLLGRSEHRSRLAALAVGDPRRRAQPRSYDRRGPGHRHRHDRRGLRRVRGVGRERLRRGTRSAPPPRHGRDLPGPVRGEGHRAAGAGRDHRDRRPGRRQHRRRVRSSRRRPRGPCSPRGPRGRRRRRLARHPPGLDGCAGCLRERRSGRRRAGSGPRRHGGAPHPREEGRARRRAGGRRGGPAVGGGGRHLDLGGDGRSNRSEASPDRLPAGPRRRSDRAGDRASASLRHLRPDRVHGQRPLPATGVRGRRRNPRPDRADRRDDRGSVGGRGSRRRRHPRGGRGAAVDTTGDERRAGALRRRARLRG